MGSKRLKKTLPEKDDYKVRQVSNKPLNKKSLGWSWVLVMVGGLFLSIVFYFATNYKNVNGLSHKFSAPLNNNKLATNFSVAIVTTWRGVDKSWAESWLRWHSALGFNRFYVFFDDPEFDKSVIKTLRASRIYADSLTIIESDTIYRKKYWAVCGINYENCTTPKEESLLLPMLGVHLLTEHTARQMMYTVRAAVLAREEDVDWLLHIDSDELFVIPKLDPFASTLNPNYAGNARDHFRLLTKKGYTHAMIFNDENLPEQPTFKLKQFKKDPFNQITLFKRNGININNQQLSLIHRWQQERKGHEYFLGYQCGKGAINIKLWFHLRRPPRIIEPILPMHVVAFAFKSFLATDVAAIIREGLSYRFDSINSNLVRIAVYTKEAKILHYVNSNLDALRIKFEARTHFHNLLFDSKVVPDNHTALFKPWKSQWHPSEDAPAASFYNDMWTRVQRDKTSAHSKHKGHSNSQALALFRTAVQAPTGALFREVIDKGLVYRTVQVRKLLQRIDKLLQLQLNKQTHNRQSTGIYNTLLTYIEHTKHYLILLTHGHFTNPIRVNITLEPTKIIGSIQDALSNPLLSYNFHRCIPQAPHYDCDTPNCCDILRSPQFTYEKRQLGYKRYGPHQWWVPGLKWPKHG